MYFPDTMLAHSMEDNIFSIFYEVRFIHSLISGVKVRPVVLYGCETWSLTLREEHRLRMFENKVLRKIFGAKKD